MLDFVWESEFVLFFFSFGCIDEINRSVEDHALVVCVGLLLDSSF